MILAVRYDMEVRIGTAGWSTPLELREGEGSLLEIYSRLFNSVEINSSFYKHHMAKTFERWAETVPSTFRFSVKLSRQITHELRLDCSLHELNHVLQPILTLREKLGCILVQLPPSLWFEANVANRFFPMLRAIYTGPVAFEPRNETWVCEEVSSLLAQFEISLVSADPNLLLYQLDYQPIEYLRLHGSPIVYRSDYGEHALRTFQRQILNALKQGRDAWCIFDNTTYGHATRNALQIQSFLKGDTYGTRNLERSY